MRITQGTVDRLTAELGHLLRVGRQLTHSASTDLFGDLPSFGWAVLAPLARDGEQRCSALAAELGVDGSVASRQIAVLERSGHVVRRPDPVDGRASLISLTPAGAQALARTRAVRGDWTLAALAGWTDADADTLCRLLARLTADLAAPHPAAEPVPSA